MNKKVFVQSLDRKINKLLAYEEKKYRFHAWRFNKGKQKKI